MFTLIALGVGAAYLYSLVATVTPWLFPEGFPTGRGGGRGFLGHAASRAFLGGGLPWGLPPPWGGPKHPKGPPPQLQPGAVLAGQHHRLEGFRPVRPSVLRRPRPERGHLL